ncbi:hypothetical protein MD484_g7190, partial [Candolleomyces efflorescens]
MAPKANKIPSANAFAALAAKDPKDPAPPQGASTKGALTIPSSAVERKINEFFQQRMKTTMTPQNGQGPSQAQKRRIEDMELTAQPPLPNKRLAREDNMNTNDQVEELISPQADKTPTQEDIAAPWYNTPNPLAASTPYTHDPPHFR